MPVSAMFSAVTLHEDWSASFSTTHNGNAKRLSQVGNNQPLRNSNNHFTTGLIAVADFEQATEKRTERRAMRKRHTAERVGIQFVGVIVLRDPEYETTGCRGSQSRRDRVPAVNHLQSAGCRERTRVVQDWQGVHLTLRRGDFGEWRLNWCSHADDSNRRFRCYIGAGLAVVFKLFSRSVRSAASVGSESAMVVRTFADWRSFMPSSNATTAAVRFCFTNS